MVYGTRLKEAMGEMHPQRLADALGISLQAVRKVLAGKSAAFDVQNHFKACTFLRIDPTWLATGEGDMRSGSTWPFGSDITPGQFKRIDETSMANAMDILKGAVARSGEIEPPSHATKR